MVGSELGGGAFVGDGGRVLCKFTVDVSLVVSTHKR